MDMAMLDKTYNRLVDNNITSISCMMGYLVLPIANVLLHGQSEEDVLEYVLSEFARLERCIHSTAVMADKHGYIISENMRDTVKHINDLRDTRDKLQKLYDEKTQTDE